MKECEIKNTAETIVEGVLDIFNDPSFNYERARKISIDMVADIMKDLLEEIMSSKQISCPPKE